MKKSIYRVLLIIWAILWALFTVRELVVKKNMNDYRTLFSLSLENKHAYITGKRLYEFIDFARARLPEGSSYKLIGIENGSIDQRRAVYYLYPRLQKDDADFLLVFDASVDVTGRYRDFAGLDSARRILVKEKVF